MGEEYTEQKVRVYKSKKVENQGKFSKYVVGPARKIFSSHGHDSKVRRLTA